MNASDDVARILRTLPIGDQLTIVQAEAERIATHYAIRGKLRAREGRGIPAATLDRLDELNATVAELPQHRTALKRLEDDCRRVGIRLIREPKRWLGHR